MSTYSVGAGYASQENAVAYSKFDRYSVYMNSDHKITDWMKVGESYRLFIQKMMLKEVQAVLALHLMLLGSLFTTLLIQLVMLVRVAL